ncbi:MAG: SMP-30/gluconolactonase/LRE family protein [Pseudomonadota bacterium]
MTTAGIYDATPCALGEGPLWHPERAGLYWFDILRFRLHTRQGAETRQWQFDEHVSAAGWIDRDQLLVVSETGFFTFDLEAGTRTDLVPLEADRTDTRSNDGRADPWGGFWVGTMSKTAAPEQGAIYRFYKGEVRLLYPDVSIPNAIAFAPDGKTATFGDTARKTVWRVALSDPDGWPVGEPQTFLDQRETGLNPDGAVFDAAGNFWCAEWGASRVACYGSDGQFQSAVAIGASHSSCPAFGGPDMSTIYCTTARQGLSAETLADGRAHGATYVASTDTRGQAEHRVIL